MISPLQTNPGPAWRRPWRLPRLGWAYVVVVTTLAALSTFSSSVSPYLVLLALTLPTGPAAQLANLVLVFGAAAVFRLDPGGTYPVLGVLTTAVWALSGWANAKLAQLGWRCVRGCWVQWRMRMRGQQA